MQAILDKGKEEFLKKYKSPVTRTGKLSDYEIIQTLGRGAFGRVLLVRLLNTEQYFALKVMLKADLVRKNLTKNILQEKDILRALDYPFLVRYQTHFKNNDYLFISMNYVIGGEVYRRIKMTGSIPLTQTRFYGSQVLLAFEYLHYLGIMYRDLKPENLLIDQTGFVQLTDFTFVKKMGSLGKTDTICGTPEYLAPELVKQLSYSYYVDYWTLGVLMYEMFFGHTPFRSGNMVTLFKNIITAKLSFNADLKPDATFTDLLENMLKPNWKDRLNTATAIKAHPFFKEVDWMALYNHKVTPEYIPVVEGPMDTTHFDTFEEEEMMDSTKNHYEKEFADF